MKSQSYMTRAMQVRDPRYAQILGKLGYGRRDAVAAKPKSEDLKTIREKYFEVVGKRPFHKWDAATLKAKIAEVKG